MREPNFYVLGVVASLVFASGSGNVARADDSEIFFGQTSSESAANVMFILDTSGSMNRTITTREPYDATRTYTGACSSTNVYYSGGSSNPPTCSTPNVIPTSQFQCAAAAAAFGTSGSGWYLDDAIRWTETTPTVRVCTGSGRRRVCTDQPGTPTYSWSTTFGDQSNTVVSDVECYGDRDTEPFPNANAPDSDSEKWTTASADSFWNLGGTRQARKFYSANYLNWYNDPTLLVSRSRIEIMKEAAESVLTSVTGVKVGLMRYSADARGGMVTREVAPLEANRDAIITSLNSYQPTGSTPLTETLWEAYRYFSGGEVDYGSSSVACANNAVDLSDPDGECVDVAIDQNSDPDYVPSPSVAASRESGLASSTNYESPMEYSCQKNFVVYLTDGLPTSDTGANGIDRILGLTDFSTLVPEGCANAGANGGCLAALTKYMQEADLRTDSEVTGKQNVVTHFIGFGSEVNSGAAFQYLQTAATAGGGQAYAAGDLDSLVTALTTIVQEARSINTTFTAASVAVNAFNRTQTLNDLYVSVFQPAATRRWSGNMKKYRIRDGEITDVSGQPAVNSETGFFADGSRSYWSSSNDGGDVNKGGAASNLQGASARNVFTYLGETNVPASPVALTSGNDFNTTNITPTHLALGAAGDPTAEQLIGWVRGEDVKNEYSDRDVRRSMGDPIHSPPAVVIYGGSPSNPDINDAVVFVPTNDGMLHAFAPQVSTDPASETVDELWAFIPTEVLPSLKDLYRNELTTERKYLLDGEIRVLKYDINGDGVVDAAAGDKVLLFLGQGRGGRRYYALDVTDKTTPKFMWSVGPTELPGLGYAWSTPTIARVNIAGADQNSQKLVVVVGGGYDPMEDDNVYHGSNSMGNAIFMIDALSGGLVWSAGIDDVDLGRDYNLHLPTMDHAIPSPVAVIDTNSDGYADRMYVGDMAGQLWRFDIRNSDNAATTDVENDATNAVAGGVIASLGAHDLTAPAAATEHRRFYNAPDVAAVQRAGAAPYFAISIGSGYRGHPLRSDANDRFYVLRDAQPFRPMSQDDYDSYAVIDDGSLTDITGSTTPTIAADSPGWKLDLTTAGEKVLSTAVTFKNQVFFTTYAPPSGISANVCSIGVGTNRAYALSIVDGSPISDLDGNGSVTANDRSVTLRQGGIAPSVSILFPGPEPDDDGDGEGDGDGNEEGEPCVGDDCPAEGEPDSGSGQQGTICLSGVEVLGTCAEFDSRVKTYWRESAAN